MVVAFITLDVSELVAGACDQEGCPRLGNPVRIVAHYVQEPFYGLKLRETDPKYEQVVIFLCKKFYFGAMVCHACWDEFFLPFIGRE